MQTVSDLEVKTQEKVSRRALSCMTGPTFCTAKVVCMEPQCWGMSTPSGIVTSGQSTSSWFSKSSVMMVRTVSPRSTGSSPGS